MSFSDYSSISSTQSVWPSQPCSKAPEMHSGTAAYNVSLTMTRPSSLPHVTALYCMQVILSGFQELCCQDRPAGFPEPELCSPSTSYSQDNQGATSDIVGSSEAYCMQFESVNYVLLCLHHVPMYPETVCFALCASLPASTRL